MHPLRVCVTGPESTGKTTLSRALAERFGALWLPEAARLYAERKASALTAADVGPIAREHVALADCVDANAALVVLDTDLLSTVVYARHYYGAAPRWLLRAERARRADLYLLCDVDVPWVPDGVRDRPDDRGAMLDLFARALARRRARVVIMRGDGEARRRSASRSIEDLLRDWSRR